LIIAPKTFLTSEYYTPPLPHGATRYYSILRDLVTPARLRKPPPRHPCDCRSPLAAKPRTHPTTIASRRPLSLDRALVINLEQALLPQARFACQAQGCDPPLRPLPVSRTMPISTPWGRPHPRLSQRAPGCNPQLRAWPPHDGFRPASRLRGTRNLPFSLSPHLAAEDPFRG
jgi:hypothetical protein